MHYSMNHTTWRRASATALTAVLLLGACGGAKKSADVSAASSAASTTAAASATTAPAGAGATSSTAKGASTTAKAKTAAGSGATATTTPASGATPAASGKGVGTRPGTYIYDSQGTSTGGTPPTTSQNSSSTNLIVDPANGNDQHLTQQGERGGTELFVRYESDRVSLVELKLNGQLAKPASPVTAFPIPLTKGKQWSWDITSTDNSTTVHAEYKVIGDEATTVAGTKVDTVRVESTMTIKTTFNGAPVTVTIDETRWQSPEYYLATKLHTVTNVPGFGSNDTTSTLRSLTPA